MVLNVWDLKKDKLVQSVKIPVENQNEGVSPGVDNIKRYDSSSDFKS